MSPDAGQGLSGFVAHWLWKVYAHFPFEGSADWLLLFVGLTLLVHLIYLPYYRLVAVKYAPEIEARLDRSGAGGVPYMLAVVAVFWIGPAFLVWFFGTDPGRTFLAGRTFDGRPLDAPSVGVHLVSALLGLTYLAVLRLRADRNEAHAFGSTESPRWLYGEEVIWNSLQLTRGLSLLLLILLHVLYWRWSIASLVLFHSQMGGLWVAGYVLLLGVQASAPPLVRAVRAGRVDDVGRLLGAGADVNVRNTSGYTPLSLAPTPEIAAMLLWHGAEIDAALPESSTPFKKAMTDDRGEVAALLLRMGATVRPDDWPNETPLHIAAERGWVEVARILIENGADIDALASYYMFSVTPLDCAELEDQDATADLIRHCGGRKSDEL